MGMRLSAQCWFSAVTPSQTFCSGQSVGSILAMFSGLFVVIHQMCWGYLRITSHARSLLALQMAWSRK
jgi:hypothetical protein